MELAKAKEAESMLRLEFEQRLAKEKEILAAKYDTEVDELRTSQGVEIEKRDAEIRKLADLWELECHRHAAELSIWRARDRKFHGGLQELEHALHGAFPFSLLHFLSFAPFPPYLSLLQKPSPVLLKARKPRWRCAG
jgi:hypothetical protein